MKIKVSYLYTELMDTVELQVNPGMTMPELLMDENFRVHREKFFAKHGIPDSELQNVRGAPKYESHHRASVWTSFNGATLVYYPFNSESKPLVTRAKLKAEENLKLEEELNRLKL